MNIKIGFLATGDEIVCGDILNTNAQLIAQQLTNNGFLVGNHLVVSDQEKDIIEGLRFLLKEHSTIIITGGLGPTSDDRTRFAVSQVVQKKLVFHEEIWQQIINRLNYYKIKIHDSNQQQALFPEGAEVISNPNGTAAACCINFENKLIFLLPGPPRECLPIVETTVLPKIIAHYGEGYHRIIKWRLFGVIEAEVANILDEAAKNYPCSTGYRIDYPYVEVKLYTEKNTDLQNLIDTLNKRFLPYQLTGSNLKASDKLIENLKNYQGELFIYDSATAGLLETKLATPEFRQKIHFNQPSSSGKQAKVIITGLKELWSSIPTRETTLTIRFEQEETITECLKTIPLRKVYYTVNYALEVIANELASYLHLN